MGTYEKKYKEANDKVAARFGTNVAKEIFADLYESEDEKIKKSLIHLIHLYGGEFGMIDANTSVEKAIAWLEKQDPKKHEEELEKAYKTADKVQYRRGYEAAIKEMEKQGEQKETLCDKCKKEQPSHSCQDITALGRCYIEGMNTSNKVEPKFKNGQWIVWKDKCYKVNYNGCGYELVDQNGLSTSLEYGTIDENAHIWDIIKDAKDGDVLVHNSITFIFKGIEDGIVKGLCSELTDYILYFSEPEHDKDYYPATKEQRDILFQKIEEAGYSWDDEKKELKKIELKSAWSEEFERMCQETIDWFEKKCFPYALENDNPARESIKWLKSLKQGIGGK